MLTLSRFRELAGSYGANLQRWPREARGEAQTLLNVSQQARAWLDEAEALDEAIAGASVRGDAAVRPIGGDDAALARLRSGVRVRIAGPVRENRPAGWRLAPGPSQWARELLAAHFTWTGMNWTGMNWVGMATGGSLAVIAGFLIGALYTSAPAPAHDAVLGMLQPIHILAE